MHIYMYNIGILMHKTPYCRGDIPSRENPCNCKFLDVRCTYTQFIFVHDAGSETCTRKSKIVVDSSQTYIFIAYNWSDF